MAKFWAAVATALVFVTAGCHGADHGPAAAGSASWEAQPSPSAVIPTAPPPDAATVALAELPANLRSRIPQFGPPPPPEKVTLPQDGTAGWFSSIPTKQKIAFITIDDGWEKNPQAEKLFLAAHVPITLFLEVNAIKSNPGYFKPLAAAGATIEDHTISHPNLRGRSYAFQKHEICGGADQLAQYYGRRPVLFRPPGGTHDATTLKVVHECGMKAAFYWKETTDHGVVFFQEGHTVKAGDIILMHFRPRFVDDFLAVLNAIHKAGLTPARLEDYIP
ncbi:polysaccharide deacetylase family protein [Actinoplanes sp. TBRC 11911]|uniref:polysaccharide deacetylase family protein n=1 Tax=Actinoplanes sp. TBRC 11911 TaxID=2729386 RepID=UPI00145C74A3|nr:polysaccharide deacetylase family protein [Actinoplanes sp. TBRC 11911]NMO55267.1 polysaccharide deacetylase family protein [Actinoplanes sp. TBRC 11911]